MKRCVVRICCFDESKLAATGRGATTAMSGTPFISAWAFGQTVTAGVAREKEVGDVNQKFGRVRVATFGSIVEAASARLLKLRNVLAARYEGIATDQLFSRVLTQSVQVDMTFPERKRRQNWVE